jgi:hypothetical protein
VKPALFLFGLALGLGTAPLIGKADAPTVNLKLPDGGTYIGHRPQRHPGRHGLFP